MWKHVLRLPRPTLVQEDIGGFLATGPRFRVIEGFRGLGKSFSTCAYSVWELWRNPQLKILIVSANENGAAANANLIKAIIFDKAGDDLWAELRPRRDQRQSTLEFDVGPAIPDKQASVKCLGVYGGLAGNRADILIPDDVENQRNSLTEDQRDKLRRAVGEFTNIIKPEPHTQIIYLGTPQTEESIYAGLPAQGFVVRVWPARYPLASKIADYGDTLAPMILRAIEANPSLCDPTGLSALGGAPSDPARFTEEALFSNEMKQGASGFMLQMMLDTSLTDAERYPLRTADLIVMDVDRDRAPVALAYASSDDKQIRDPAMPNYGFTGDRFYAPFNVSEHWADYTGTVMHIDPAGTGADETAYCVTKFLNGRIFVTGWGGLTGGASGTTLNQLADLAKQHVVNEVVVEDNFGDGMYRQLLSPILQSRVSSKWRCGLKGVKVTGQKEKRIIGSLEPVMNRHKLVLDREVVRQDLKSDRVRSGIFQLTHITASRGALKHDDRIDVLAQAVEYWKTYMAVDDEKAEAEHLKKLDREWEKRYFADTPIGQLLNKKGRTRAPGRPWKR